jgi:hypothetical protein
MDLNSKSIGLVLLQVELKGFSTCMPLNLRRKKYFPFQDSRNKFRINCRSLYAWGKTPEEILVSLNLLFSLASYNLRKQA